MKKIALALIVFLGIIAAATAADTYTTKLNLVKPEVGSYGWGTKTNGDWDIVDNLARGQIPLVLQVSTMNSTFIGFGRNRALNGDFRFDQRYEGAKSTSTSSAKWYLDHWGLFADTATFTIQRDSQNPPVGFNNYLRCTVTNKSVSGSTSTQRVDSTNGFFTRLEGPYMKDWNWGTVNAKTITISFVAISSATGNYAFSMKNTDNSRSYIANYAIPTANVWTPISVTIPGDTTGAWFTGAGTRGAEIDFDIGSGANNENSAGVWLGANRFRVAGNVMLSTQTVGTSFALAGFQVEVGPISTAFEYVPDDFELRQLQRYCEKSYAIGTATGAATSTNGVGVTCVQVGASTVYSNDYAFKVKKLSVTPTMSYWATDGTASQWTFTSTIGANTKRNITSDNVDDNAFGIQQTTALEYFAFGHFLAESEVP